MKVKHSLQVWRRAPAKLKLAATGLCVATVGVPLLLSSYQYSTLQLVLAMILLDLCLYPTFRYIARRETGLPIMPVLCLSFAVQYAAPIFTQEAKIDLVAGVLYLENEAVIAALLLAILGVVVLQLTYYLIRNGRVTQAIPCVSLHLSERRAEIFCVAAFFISLFASRFQNMLSEETALQFSAIFNLLQNQLLVAIAILAWLAFSVRKQKRHTLMVYLLVSFTALRGFSTTMLEMMIVPLAVLFMAKWTYTKKLPVLGLTAIALALLFFSPVKMNIRKAALDEAQTGRGEGTVSRATDWVTQASAYWWDAVSGRTRFVESTADASSRTDLIHQFAYMYSMTPSVLPYQYGATYKYFVVTFIPRVVWPEKPEANYANRFYALSYNISTEEVMQTSSFGITVLGEGYINFGAAGSLLALVVLGFLLALFEHVFGSTRSGVGGQAVFLAIFIFFLNGIGTSTEVLLGGLLQNFVGCAFFLWLVKERRAISKTGNSSPPSLQALRA